MTANRDMIDCLARLRALRAQLDILTDEIEHMEGRVAEEPAPISNTTGIRPFAAYLSFGGRLARIGDELRAIGEKIANQQRNA